MRRQERIAAGICFLIGLVCIFLSQCAEARDFRLIELKRVTIDYKDYFSGGYSPLINDVGGPNTEPGRHLAIRFDIDFAKFFYFNNRVHGTTDEIRNSGGKGQFRAIGYEFQLGFRPSRYVYVEYAHHSQHALDAILPTRFPVEDSVGIKLIVYLDDTPSATLIP